jgi:hypothetical protein
VGDAAGYYAWAQRIAGGEWIGEESFYQAPLYPYVLAFFNLITGGDLFLVRLLQHAIGVLGVWGIYRLARSLSSEGTAKFAGLGAAIYLPSEATIKIFSLDGDLVREMHHPDPNLSDSDSHLAWDMVSRNIQAIVSGIYLYTVESELGTQVGKIVVIK